MCKIKMVEKYIRNSTKDAVVDISEVHGLHALVDKFEYGFWDKLWNKESHIEKMRTTFTAGQKTEFDYGTLGLNWEELEWFEFSEDAIKAHTLRVMGKEATIEEFKEFITEKYYAEEVSYHLRRFD